MKNHKKVYGFIGFILFLILWQLISVIMKSPALPEVKVILATVFSLLADVTFLQHIGSSLFIVLAGIISAIILGCILALFMYRYRIMLMLFNPLLDSIRSISAISLFPLIIMLLGIGNLSRIFIIFWTAWPAVIISTIASLQIDNSVIEAAQIDGAADGRILFKIRLPIARDNILTGVRIAIGSGWISLTAAEMLGATKGLGYFLLWSSQSFEFGKVYAAILLIAFLGGLMNYIILFLQRRLKSND